MIYGKGRIIIDVPIERVCLSVDHAPAILAYPGTYEHLKSLGLAQCKLEEAGVCGRVIFEHVCPECGKRSVMYSVKSYKP